jgi:hypothetical protein
VCQTYKIKSLINQLNSKEIPNIIKECESMGWESYHTKIYRAIGQKPLYQAILQRIQDNIHSEQFRIDSMLFAVFFEQVNGDRLTECIALYGGAI